MGAGAAGLAAEPPSGRPCCALVACLNSPPTRWQSRPAGGESMTENTIPADIAKLSFEDALSELQTLVKALEKGDSKLDDAINSYQRGVDLKRHCEAKLREAQLKVDRIVQSADGTLTTEPAKID
jgi:exodeoxyribonuclease VII small subunit